MKPIKTEHFLFYPRKTESLAGTETVISELNRIRGAGPFIFEKLPFFNDRITANEVVCVPFEAWVVARIACLTSVQPAEMVEFDRDEYNRVFLVMWLEVQDHASHVVANLVLRANFSFLRWEGCAASVEVGQNVMSELEASLTADPMQLQPYELDGSERGKLGWDGRSFLGEERVQRPTKLPKSSYEFRITKSARYLDAGNDPKKRRFAGTWPPPTLLESVANWDFASSEQDDTILIPASNQRLIDYKIAYTAAEVWLPDGRVVACLIALDEGMPYGIVLLDIEGAWELPCWDKRFDHGVVPIVGLTKEQEGLFPMRVVSRLPRSSRNTAKTMRFEINKDDWTRPWKLKG